MTMELPKAPKIMKSVFVIQNSHAYLHLSIVQSVSEESVRDFF